MVTKLWMRKTSITGIYKITSPTGRIYIGQSWDIKNRWRLHKSVKSGGCPILKKSLQKHGIESHKFEVIHALPADITQVTLDSYEILYIDVYKSAGFKMMNIKEGGGNAKPSESTRKKMSISGKKNTHGFKKGNIPWNRGKKSDTPVWNKGLIGIIKFSEETKNKIRLANIGHKRSLGKKMGEKCRAALRKANVGRVVPCDVRQIISQKSIGNKRGAGNKGKVRSEAVKQLHSRIQKARLDNKGEFNNNAKLTDKQVLEIREKYIPHIYSSRRLGIEYNLSKTNVLDIVNNRIWTHTK